MSIITFAEARPHLRASTPVTSPDPDEDLINIYIGAAEDYIREYLDRQTIPKKDAIKAAALLIVGDLYENRQAQQESGIKDNPAVHRLLFPYRRNLGV